MAAFVPLGATLQAEALEKVDDELGFIMQEHSVSEDVRAKLYHGGIVSPRLLVGLGEDRAMVRRTWDSRGQATSRGSWLPGRL